jgi:hypothetical protein
MAAPIALTVVEQLLGVPPGYPPWRIADMARRARALPTWLSTATARGVALTPAALGLLERERARVASLHATALDMGATHRVTVIKGVRIAAHMPHGMLRQSGDVDLVAQDEQAMWACVRDLIARVRAVPQGVSVMRGLDSNDVQFGVALKWPADEPYLDKPMGADVTTCAFAGDFRGVPIRVAPPADDDLCSLFAVTEERFQRRYRLKDLLDLLVLADVLETRFGDDVLGVVLELARALCLAPELAKLIGQADEWVPVSALWAKILDELHPLVRGEKARRARVAADGGPGMHALFFGMPLDDVASPGDRATIISRPGGDIITTPVGTCLLVSSPVVDADERERAIEFARSLR